MGKLSALVIFVCMISLASASDLQMVDEGITTNRQYNMLMPEDYSVINITSFLQLGDTPDSYAGDGEKCVAVNVGEDGLEFIDCGSGGETYYAGQDIEINGSNYISVNRTSLEDYFDTVYALIGDVFSGSWNDLTDIPNNITYLNYSNPGYVNATGFNTDGDVFVGDEIKMGDGGLGNGLGYDGIFSSDNGTVDLQVESEPASLDNPIFKFTSYEFLVDNLIVPHITSDTNYISFGKDIIIANKDTRSSGTLFFPKSGIVGTKEGLEITYNNDTDVADFRTVGNNDMMFYEAGSGDGLNATFKGNVSAECIKVRDSDYICNWSEIGGGGGSDTNCSASGSCPNITYLNYSNLGYVNATNFYADYDVVAEDEVIGKRRGLFGGVTETEYNLTEDIFALWNCDDNAGNTVVTDSSGNSNNAIAGTNTNNLNTVGKINGAFELSGVTPDYFYINDEADLSFTNDVSACMWVNFDNPDTGDPLIAKGDAGPSGGYDFEWALYIYQRSNGKQKFGVKFGGDDGDLAGVYYADDTYCADGNWCHVCFTYSHADVELYFNGSEIPGKVASSYPIPDTLNDDTDPLYVGFDFNQFLDADVDNVIISGTKFTADAISEIYNSGNGRNNVTGIEGSYNMTAVSSSEQQTPKYHSGRTEDLTVQGDTELLGNVWVDEDFIVGGIILGDNQKIEYGVGGEEGGTFGADAMTYSDGDNYRMQIESPELGGGNVSIRTNPFFKLEYYDYWDRDLGANYFHAWTVALTSTDGKNVFSGDNWFVGDTASSDGEIFVGGGNFSQFGNYNALRLAYDVSEDEGLIDTVGSKDIKIDPSSGWTYLGDNDKLAFGNDKDSWIYWDGTNMVFNTTTGLGYFSGNVSSTGFNTRTQVNTDENVLETFKTGDELLNPDGSINHSAFDECHRLIEVTDFTRPVNETYYINESTMVEVNGTWEEQFSLVAHNRTIYPHKKNESQVDVTCVTAKLTQLGGVLNEVMTINKIDLLTDFDTAVAVEALYTNTPTDIRPPQERKNEFEEIINMTRDSGNIRDRDGKVKEEFMAEPIVSDKPQYSYSVLDMVEKVYEWVLDLGVDVRDLEKENQEQSAKIEELELRIKELERRK